MKSLGKHVLGLPRIYCPFCGITCNEKTLLNDHLIARHGIGESNSVAVLNTILGAYRSAAGTYVESQASQFERPTAASAIAEGPNSENVVMPEINLRIPPAAKG